MPAYVHKDPSKGPVRDAELHGIKTSCSMCSLALSGKQADSPAYKISPSYQRDVKEGKEQKE